MDKIEQIKELTAELLNHCHLYYDLDDPAISDAEYDKKFDELKQLEDEANFWLANSPTRKVQGEVLPYLEKVHHSVPMLSADKSTNIDDVKKFIGDKNIVVSFKLDGSTVVVKYNNGQLIQGLSRGSGIDGENITHTVKMIKNLPMTIPYKGYLEVRGEALIHWKHYNKMNVDGSLGHPRNVASGALRQLDANEAAKRNIFFYAFTLVNWKEVLDSMYPNRYGSNYKGVTLNFLEKQGFDVVPYCVFDNASVLNNIESITSSYFDRSKCDMPTDGWCFEYDDLVYGESLGSTGHHDRRLYALKPTVEEYKTTLRDVEWTLGKTGQLTPTAIFDPTEIDNTTITRASVHNISIIKSLGLKIGGKCFVHKANMIIPQILRCEGGDFDVEIPKYCPVCGGKTEIVTENASEVLMCKNSNCSGKLLGRLKFFVSKPAMNIDGISESILDFLIEKEWVKSFVDIYHLVDHKDEWQKCEGFGEKSVEKVLNAVEKSRDVKLENFICALSIPNIGKSAAKTISDKFNGDYIEFSHAYEDYFDWTELDDFGEITAKNLESYLQKYYKDVNELASEMHFVKRETKVVFTNPFNGRTLCVTGKLNHFTRDSINAKIAELGAKATGSVSKNTDYLITNEASGSSKYKKAVELHVPIITEDEFLKMIGE